MGFLLESGIHNDDPFKKDFFKRIELIQIDDGNKSEVRKWLYQIGLPFKKLVFLSYTPEISMLVPWKILIKYYDEFYYPSSDDLTVFDESLSWAVLFHHEETAYFGSNEECF